MVGIGSPAASVESGRPLGASRPVADAGLSLSGRAAGDLGAPGIREDRFGPATVVSIRSAQRRHSAGSVEEGGSAGSVGTDGLSADEKRQVEKLRARDQEVRRHEQAHAAAGGQYASAPSYVYQTGPDGKRYAVAGEVQIDTSPGRTPEETVRKAETIRRAATAPDDPSPQDDKVAQLAEAMRQEALQRIREERKEDQSAPDRDGGKVKSAADRHAEALAAYTTVGALGRRRLESVNLFA